MSTSRPFELLVIGDEILSGKRQDRHFPKLRELLAARGLSLARVQYLGDDRARLTSALRELDPEAIVFSCGGIGATPDDHTRQAAAAAFDRPLRLHPGARELIAAHMAEIGQELTQERLRMGEFPEGAELIPNPYNRIPGFSLGDHHFLPGFPVMAWPMLEWLLETRYRALFRESPPAERALRARGLNEGTLTPLLDAIERDFAGVRVFSLPRVDPEKRYVYEIELGVKGEIADTDQAGHLEAAFARLRDGVLALGGTIQPEAPDSGR
jgi:molybdopterin-biosynthesis enzyme MoeA-like protein